MLQLFPEHIEQIRTEAVEAYPNEACWLITASGCTQVANRHSDPENFFDIAAEDVRKAHAKTLLAVVHSHTNGKDYPSQADMQSQVNTDVPWGILTCGAEMAGKIFWWGGAEKDQIEPLEDRTFRHGTSDCYALVRDWFFLEKGIELPEFPREWRWWDTDADLLSEGFDKAGFTVVRDTPKPGDVWLASMSSKSSKLNHCGVLLDNELTYHHPGANTPVSHSKKATIEPIYIYLPRINLWVRHKDLAV